MKDNIDYKKIIKYTKKEAKQIKSKTIEAKEKIITEYKNVKPIATELLDNVKDCYRKNPKILPVFLLLVFVVVMINFPKFRDNQLENLEQVELKTSLKDYGINSNTAFEKTTIKEVKELNKSESNYILHICSPVDPYCQLYTPILYDCAIEQNQKIKYINTEKLPSYNWDEMIKLFPQVLNAETVPTTIFIKNGQPVMAQKKSNEQLNIDNLSNKQKTHLKESYIKGFEKIKK